MALFPNSSQAQEFLGSFDGHDLYWDPQSGSLPTVIARYGSEGHEYKSGLALADHDAHLCEARRLAELRGFAVKI